ncbi:MAG: serine/threonine-protein kinase, partial [Anaerolineales bacterium]
SQNFAFLLERYVDGPTLKQITRQQKGEPLPLEDILSYLKALSAALGYAHAHEVVHCDMKPGNVMVDQGGVIYLTDFGIARHAESTVTTLGVAGTPAYMAPEQIREDPVSPATDVYALGVMLFEMLTGQRPFKGSEGDTGSTGKTAAERIRYAHLHLPPPNPSSINSIVPEALSQVVLKALSKNPKERQQSVRELYEEVLAACGWKDEQVPERIALMLEDMPTAASVVQSSIPETSQLHKQEKPISRKLPIWFWFVGGFIILSALFFAVSSNRSALTIAQIRTLTPTVSPTQAPNKPSNPTSTQTPTFTPTSTPTPTNTPLPTPTPIPTLPPAFSWTTEVIQKAQAVGYFTSLVIDNQGYFHIVYFQENSDVVWYAHNSSGEWIFDTVIGGQEKGFHLSLQLDKEGIPNIAYHILGNKQSPRVHYLRWIGQDWELIKVSEAFSANTDVSLYLGPDDRPHIIYLDGYSYNVKYMNFNKQRGWDTQTVDAARQDCQSFPLIVDTDGTPHILYCALNGGLMYATLIGNVWNRVVVDQNNGAGLFSSLVLDKNGNPHVAYYDPQTQALKYAFWTGNTWEIQVVDEEGDVGKHPSIAVDLNGYIHISYYDATNTALKYAHGREGQWNIYMVDNVGDVGKWNSLALSPEGLPRISYLDETNEDLKFALANPLSPP